MTVSKAGAHRKLPGWQKGLELAEQVYRLAEVVTAARGQALADLLLARIIELPALVAQGGPGSELARARLLEVEAGLLLAVRLRYLSEAQIAPALALVEALSNELPAADPAPAVRETVKAPVVAASAAAPVPAATTPRASVAPPSAREVPAAAPRVPSTPPSVEKDYLLLDGCNFLGCSPGYELGDDSSRDRLLLRLQEYAREHPAHKVVVFFDGKRASSRLTNGVEERVSSGLHSADDLMVDYVRGLPREHRRRTTLVTNDRDLGERARREGVRAESVQWLSTRFVRRPAPDEQKRGLSRSQVSEWEQFFNEPPKRPGKK